MYARDMFCFNALLIYEITLEIKSMVHLKRIACLAEAVAQIVNEWDNPFFV